MIKAMANTLILEYGPIDHAGRPLSAFQMYGIVKSKKQLPSLKKQLTEEFNKSRSKPNTKPAQIKFNLYSYNTATGSTLIE